MNTAPETQSYLGLRTFENGRREERTFDTYEACVLWLAEDADAGIAAYYHGVPIDQVCLQNIVAQPRQLRLALA